MYKRQIKYAKKNNIAYTETKAAASGNNSGNTSANITRKKVTVTALTSPKTRTIKLKWKKLSGADGYEIQYARNAKFTRNKKKVTVKKAAATSKTIKKLKTTVIVLAIVAGVIALGFVAYVVFDIVRKNKAVCAEAKEVEDKKEE